MRLILLITIIFIAFGCSQNLSNSTYQPSEKSKIASEVRKRVAVKLQKEKGLRPCGTGGQMMHEIKMLALSFNYRGEIGIDKGRELLIDAVTEFISAVNADEPIRPYLNNYPFEPKNIEIRIFLKNLDGSELSMDKLHVLSAIDNVLEYDICDPETTRLKTVYEETYEEALQKLAQRKGEYK